MREDGVGVHLAGVVDHIGEHRHHLAKGGGFLQESLVQAAHLGPKANSRHGEFSLETLFQVGIQALVLLRRKSKLSGMCMG